MRMCIGKPAKMDESNPRKISEKKIAKNEDLQLNLIKNNIVKYGAELTDDFKHNSVLIGDSKVRHLEELMTNKTHIVSFWRSGATLDNVALRRHVDRHISRYNRPVVILFFNTCSLTGFSDETRTYIDLTENSAEIVNVIIEQYKQFKQQRLYQKPSAKIIFIECPFYSIIEWNLKKEHPNPDSFKDSQHRLEGLITELNAKIKELNEPYNPPQVSRDMIFKIKKKANHRPTQLIAYRALLDGIHPDEYISELWLIRINNFINTINKEQ